MKMTVDKREKNTAFGRVPNLKVFSYRGKKYIKAHYAPIWMRGNAENLETHKPSTFAWKTLVKIERRVNHV